MLIIGPETPRYIELNIANPFLPHKIIPRVKYFYYEVSQR